MLKLGVIKPVYKATPWISSFAIIETSKDTNSKTGAQDSHPKMKLGIYLEPSNLNNATTRNLTTTGPLKMLYQNYMLPNILSS